MTVRAFDEVDYDACTHDGAQVDVTGQDTPDGVTERVCADCGHTTRSSAVEQLPRASLASPVSYRRLDEPETLDTIDGRVHAHVGDVLVIHHDGRQRVMPDWLFGAIYWPEVGE